MKTKQIQQEIATKMRKWQQTENRAVVITGQMMEKTQNPLLRLVMEIIQRDSQLHHRIQQFLIDSVEGKSVALSPEELGEISSLLGKHKRVEDDMLCQVEELLGKLKGKRLLAQEYFLNFLLTDEDKHCKMLGALDTFKKGIYPYA
jgi:hypothetical protein